MKKTITCTFSFLLCTFIYISPLFQSYAQTPVWQNEIRDLPTWQHLSKLERDAEFSKFVLDLKSDHMYFFDANEFKLHIDFGLNVLLHQERTPANIKSFNRNYGRDKPQFILGYLTHYPKLDLWTFSFWEGDAISARDVARAYDALQKTFFVKNMVFRPDSMSQEIMAKGLPLNIKIVTNDKIYNVLPFQSFQTGKATGILRIIPAGTACDLFNFQISDIALLDEVCVDINPVAGIITTKFSTPLAHVNLRASAWGIPNAGDKHAAEKYAALKDKIVTYEVTEQNLSLRLANEEEKKFFEEKDNYRRKIQLPQANLENKSLRPLSEIEAGDVYIYGSKTSNLGEIASHQISKVNVPRGFGVPFYYYVNHIKTNNQIKNLIDSILDDSRFKSDLDWQRTQLEGLRKAIIDAPMDPQDFQLIVEAWHKQLGGKGVFVRSSTNAEDLKNFNGAGLYDTVPNVISEAGLENAIKKVWASLWNAHAVAEREFAGIDERQVYSAVLIQTGIDATAAGVLLTIDIWGHNPHTFTINAKWGLGIRVVEGTNIPEQVLYDSSNKGTRIISRSSESTMLVFDELSGVKEVPVSKGDTILSEMRAARLGEAVMQIIPLFSSGGEETPLDVEWLLEGEKIWIVQARPYVAH
jgi:hypothetical protein